MSPARSLALLALPALGALLQGCGGTLYATVKDARGRDVMLVGHDPVAYFTQGRPVQGKPALAVELPQRTYYFASEQHRSLFVAAPDKYEPQYGGFCSNGMAYGLKMSSDPTSWTIFEGRLFVFGDVLGQAQWSLTPRFNVEKGDLMWASEAKDMPWREQTFRRWVNRVPWYRTRWQIREDWEKANPGKSYPSYDPGGWFTNLLFKYPGWRVIEGYSQPKIELPRE
jgi:YHS domain-containing protein